VVEQATDNKAEKNRKVSSFQQLKLMVLDSRGQPALEENES
jgi:hypothetical protein